MLQGDLARWYLRSCRVLSLHRTACRDRCLQDTRPVLRKSREDRPSASPILSGHGWNSFLSPWESERRPGKTASFEVAKLNRPNRSLGNRQSRRAQALSTSVRAEDGQGRKSCGDLPGSGLRGDARKAVSTLAIPFAAGDSTRASARNACRSSCRAGFDEHRHSHCFRRRWCIRYDRLLQRGGAMSESGIARIFKDGQSQVVLPALGVSPAW